MDINKERAKLLRRFTRRHNTVLELLKLAKPHFDKYALQAKKADLQRGFFVTKEGIYIPRNDARVLYDHYEIMLIDTLEIAFRNYHKKSKDILLPFMQRTLYELAIKKAPIIFSATLSAEEKQRYKLMAILMDYLYLASNPTYNNYFKSLLASEGHLLTQKEKQVFQSEFESTLRADRNAKSDYVPNKARRLQNEFERRMWDKISEETLDSEIFQYTQLGRMYMHLSALLHGNFIGVAEALNRQNIARYQMRGEVWLMICELSVVKSLAGRINDPKVQQVWKRLERSMHDMHEPLTKIWEQVTKDNVL